MVKFKIKKGDQVIVRVGSKKDGKRGTTGEVIKVFPAEGKVLVSGVNQFTRNIKPSQQNPEGKKDVHHPIHISNVALIIPGTDTFTKVGYKIEGDKKVKFAKKTGNTLN